MDRVDDSYGPNDHEDTPPHHIWTLQLERDGEATTTTDDATEYPELALYIDGEWTDGAGGRGDDVVNPATEEVLGRVPFAEPGRTSTAAIAAAERGLPGVARRRARRAASAILHKAAACCTSGPREIGRVMTLEQGKPLPEAAGEVHRAAAALRVGRRGGPPRLRADHPDRPRTRSCPCGRAGRPGRRVRAVELPGRRADAQDRRGAGGRLLDRDQAVRGGAGHASALVARASPTPGCRPGVLNLVFGVPAEISAHR